MAISLKQWLDSNPKPNSPAGFLCLPEVGDGVQVALRRLTLGEYRQLQAEQKAEGDPLEKMARLLARCVVADDGTPWAGPDLADLLPLTACQRIIAETLKANVADVSEGKGSSPATPSPA
jgi:hypothetical protein